MLFVLQTPSLQHVAGVKTVTALWNRADILNSTLREQLYSPEWKAIEDRVEANLSALEIPTQLKQQFGRFIKPIGEEISRWYDYHNIRYFSPWVNSVFPRQFHWTMRGTVDYKKTAELIIEDETVDAEKRYVIACRNCLEDEARRLIQRISEERRRQLVEEARDGVGGFQNDLVIFFTCTLSNWPDALHQHFRQEGSRRSESIHERLFQDSLHWGDRWMWEYLFLKINPSQRDRVFSENEDLHLGTFNLYYLSLMSGEQQERAFQQFTESILKYLLDWPMQTLFVEAAQRGWRLMDTDGCSEVLFAVAERISPGKVDADYPHLFWECWRLTPSDYQRQFLYDDAIHFLEDASRLLKILDTEEEEIIKLVLNEAPPRQILFLSEGTGENRRLRQRLIHNDTFEAALKECTAKAESESSTDANSRLRCKYLKQLAEFVAEGRKRF